MAEDKFFQEEDMFVMVRGPAQQVQWPGTLQVNDPTYFQVISA